MNKMMLNKKHSLIPIALVLVATMLMTPMANARLTTTYVDTPVIASYGVTDPNNIGGNSADQKYAIFDGYDSKVVAKWTIDTALPSGAVVKITGHKNTGTPQIALYASNSATSGWVLIGWASLGSSDTQVQFSGSAGGYKYFSIAVSNGGVYVDWVIAQY